MGVHEPKYSSTLPSSEFATGAHLSSEIENELGRSILPDSPRTGYLGYQMITAMEPLFYQYGVDLVSNTLHQLLHSALLCWQILVSRAALLVRECDIFCQFEVDLVANATWKLLTSAYGLGDICMWFGSD